MKIALLADIHGNAAALAAVLAEVRAAGIDRLLVAGDLIGYYHEPAEVLRQLAGWEASFVRGNHEEMLREVRRDPTRRDAIRAKYGSGIDRALTTLSEAQQAWLLDLPHPLEVALGGRRLLLCHGSPDDLDRYVYPDAPPAELDACGVPGYDAVIMGHTHYPFVRRVGTTLVINPGSVGQPRNRRPGAAWATLDLSRNEATHHVTPYDHMAVAAEARRHDPDVPYLSEVLSRQ